MWRSRIALVACLSLLSLLPGTTAAPDLAAVDSEKRTGLQSEEVACVVAAGTDAAAPGCGTAAAGNDDSDEGATAAALETASRRLKGPPDTKCQLATAPNPAVQATPTPPPPLVCGAGQQPCGAWSASGGAGGPNSVCCDRDSECIVTGVWQGSSTGCRRKDRITTCDPNPCSNGGICALWSSSTFNTVVFQCECLADWEGVKCATRKTVPYAPPVYTVPTPPMKQVYTDSTIIQAEDFSNRGGEGVDYHNIPKGEPGPKSNVLRSTAISLEWFPFNQGSSGAEQSTVVSWTGPGEWLRYEINVVTAGTYEPVYIIARGVVTPAPVGFSFLVDPPATPFKESADRRCRNNPKKMQTDQSTQRQSAAQQQAGLDPPAAEALPKQEDKPPDAAATQQQPDARGPPAAAGAKVPQLRRSCNLCVQLKRKCSGDSPCTLCVRKGIECVRAFKRPSGPAKGTRYVTGKRFKRALLGGQPEAVAKMQQHLQQRAAKGSRRGAAQLLTYQQAAAAAAANGLAGLGSGGVLGRAGLSGRASDGPGGAPIRRSPHLGHGSGGALRGATAAAVAHAASWGRRQRQRWRRRRRRHGSAQEDFGMTSQGSAEQCYSDSSGGGEAQYTVPHGVKAEANGGALGWPGGYQGMMGSIAAYHHQQQQRAQLYSLQQQHQQQYGLSAAAQHMQQVSSLGGPAPNIRNSMFVVSNDMGARGALEAADAFGGGGAGDISLAPLQQGGRINWLHQQLLDGGGSGSGGAGGSKAFAHDGSVDGSGGGDGADVPSPSLEFVPSAEPVANQYH
ncbi:hypothetical protein JKP88DRAFT_262619 [Tribonema minus]|uniref:Zn(2)-C6 fungal-type domain-containing protein n=1 Tax=Tribonema minus TaxID=303371 RepID=A0A835Z8Y1_9STRA|nr:hypothetical protein JKP88DRAFT_262619 [Tribonema minus]